MELCTVENTEFNIRIYYNEIVPELVKLKERFGEENLRNLLNTIATVNANEELIRNSNTLNFDLDGKKYELLKGEDYRILI